MHKGFIHAAGVFAVVFASLTMSATPAHAEDGWCSKSATIAGLYFEFGGMTLVMNGGLQAMGCPNLCGGTGGYLSIPGTAAQYQDFRTLALAAFFANHSIQIATAGCIGNRPIVGSMNIWQ